jgi:hypothetical protein
MFSLPWKSWIPALAGMTVVGLDGRNKSSGVSEVELPSIRTIFNFFAFGRSCRTGHKGDKTVILAKAGIHVFAAPEKLDFRLHGNDSERGDKISSTLVP